MNNAQVQMVSIHCDMHMCVYICVCLCTLSIGQGLLVVKVKNNLEVHAQLLVYQSLVGLCWVSGLFTLHTTHI